MENLFDPIRNCTVLALPEEKVRQNLIYTMIEDLDYPKSMISVEKDLKNMPHIVDKDFSSNKRRVDILCFSPNISKEDPLYPLLLIECKAIPLDQKVIQQAIGYNHYIKACFLCVVNQDEIKTLWFDEVKHDYISIDFLPTYKELENAVRVK